MICGTKDMLGERLKPDDAGYVEGKEIYKGGLPRPMQYLWTYYEAEVAGSGEYPVDFTWEREWRFKPSSGKVGLPLVLMNWVLAFEDGTPGGAVVVERDEDVGSLREKLVDLEDAGLKWPQHLWLIVSLETAKRKLAEGDPRYARIDTWPSDET